jgi:GNAT superfamily N-acetyltransferase
MPVDARSLEFRQLATGDESAALELWRATLTSSTRPATVDYWRWKHSANPFGTSVLLGAFSGEDLVGLRPLLPWRFSSGEASVLACRAVDTAVHSSWRRQGLFTELTSSSLELARARRIRFVFNTPNRRSRAGYLKLGWREAGRVPALIRPRWSRLQSRASPHSGTPGRDGVSVGLPVKCLLDEPTFEALTARWGATDSRFRTERTADYFAWRYQWVPGISYRAAWSLNEERSVAVVYRTRVRHGRRELSVCELIADPGAGAAATSLFEAVERHEHPDYSVAAATRNTIERRMLRGMGFLPVSILAPRVVARPIGSDSPWAVALSSWRPSLGDFELF